VTYRVIDPETVLEVDAPGGIELLVIAGSLTEGPDLLEKGSWLRLPEGAALSARSGPEGAKVWMKTGHLPFAAAPAS
jgi:hypothetical protein